MENMSPWVLRIVLDRFKKEDKGANCFFIAYLSWLLSTVSGLSNADIAERINLDFGGDLRCIFSSDNAEKPVLQIRMTNEDESTRPEDGLDEEDLFLKKIEQNLLNQMHLRGIDG